MKITDRKYLNVDTKTCHASTSVHYKGKTIFAWFGGEREGLVDSAIYIQFGDESSSGVYHIGTDKAMARWNPILFTHDDRLYIFIKAGDFCDRWQTFLYDITEMESGVASPMQFVPAGLNGPVKTKPIFDEKTGLIYCGSSVETRFDWTSYIEVYKFEGDLLKPVYRTLPLIAPKNTYTQGFGTRQRQSAGIIQPSLWIDNNREIHAFFRSSTGLDKLYYSSSGLMEDEYDISSFCWSDPEPIDHIENPNSGVDTIFYDGRLFLIYNPDPINRKPLTLAELDPEDGFTIKDEIIITDKVPLDEPTHSKELSYPYMIEKDGTITLTYTYGRTKIEYVRIKI